MARACDCMKSHGVASNCYYLIYQRPNVVVYSTLTESKSKFEVGVEAESLQTRVQDRGSSVLSGTGLVYQGLVWPIWYQRLSVHYLASKMTNCCQSVISVFIHFKISKVTKLLVWNKKIDLTKCQAWLGLHSRVLTTRVLVQVQVLSRRVQVMS